MTQYTIDIGAVPDDGQGDPLRTAFDYTNLNFNQIFTAGPVGSNVKIFDNTITTTVINSNLVLSPSGIGRIQVNNTLFPRADNVYDLGSPTSRFNSIYVGTGGLNIPVISVTGNITGNNIFATGFMSSAGNVVSGAAFLGTSLSVSDATVYGNIATIAVNATGNIAASYFIGNGSLLTGIAVGNSDNISNGTSSISIPVANGNIVVTANGVANTVVFTSQGLTANSVITSGLMQVGGNAIVAGEITSGGLIAGSELQASRALIFGNIDTAILSASGNITGNNITAVGNVLTTGVVSATGNIATSNYFLGNGAFLTGVARNSSNISNGSSNVNVATANGNVTIGVNGTSNVAVFANTGAYITGNVSATGNVTATNFIGNIIGNLLVPGANTDILFNDNGSAGATSGFTFNKTSNLVTVGGNVSAVGFIGNGAGLANVMADRGSDPNNWNTLTQMGVYAVNRTSWAGTTGTPLDSQVFVGVLEVMNSGNTALSQVFYPGTVTTDTKIQWTRNYWASVWTSWILMTSDGQTITGGDF